MAEGNCGRATCATQPEEQPCLPEVRGRAPFSSFEAHGTYKLLAEPTVDAVRATGGLKIFGNLPAVNSISVPAGGGALALAADIDASRGERHPAFGWYQAPTWPDSDPAS